MIYLKPNKKGVKRRLSDEEQSRLSRNRRLWFFKRKYKNLDYSIFNTIYDYDRTQEKRLSDTERLALYKSDISSRNGTIC